MNTPTKRRVTLTEIRRQRAQLAGACYNAIAAMDDARQLMDAGDAFGAAVTLANAIEATRADLTGARARPR